MNRNEGYPGTARFSLTANLLTLSYDLQVSMSYVPESPAMNMFFFPPPFKYAPLCRDHGGIAILLGYKDPFPASYTVQIAISGISGLYDNALNHNLPVSYTGNKDMVPYMIGN
ncbi:MAG: hypothetical protein NTX36_16295 [Proteobacteria bacterium]|nr:hypothetical protein [Pseudomonadota bacterium]